MAHHLEEPPPGMVVFGILFKMRRELLDLPRCERDLHRRGSGVFLVYLVFRHYFCFDAFGQHKSNHNLKPKKWQGVPVFIPKGTGYFVLKMPRISSPALFR